MSQRRPGLLLAAVLATAGLTALPAAPAGAQTAPCVIAAAGDIAGSSDYRTGAARTAQQIIDRKPTATFALGDLAYSSGTLAEFRDYYLPTWGRIPDVQAIAGNHEYRTAGADGMEAALGEASNDNRGVSVCGWRVVLLNQYKGVTAAARYLEAQRAAHPRVPLIAVWHEPRFSSGSEHGSEPGVQTLWAYSRGAAARIVLTAHDHDYERFAPLNVNGNPASNGTRQFVSGLGGHGIRPMGTTVRNSQRRYTGQPGVLYLTLRTNGGYDWSFRTVDGVVRDSGTQSAL